MPVLLCTVFSFSALFFPIDSAKGGTPGIFSRNLDAEALAERNNVAATMLLASSALLSTLARASFLVPAGVPSRGVPSRGVPGTKGPHVNR